MSTVLPALNAHIRKQARREVNDQVSKTKKASSQHRRDIAALKRAIKSLAGRIASLERSGPASAPSGGGTEMQRFRADGLRTHRNKLGLSARDYGRLVGVSGLTIYNWEAGKAKPRQKIMAALSGVRAMGKRDAHRQLEELAK